MYTINISIFKKKCINDLLKVANVSADRMLSGSGFSIEGAPRL